MADEKLKNVFKVADKEYDRDKLINTITRNADSYALYRLLLLPGKRNIFGKIRLEAFDTEGFQSAISDVTLAIADGRLSKTANNTYVNSDGTVWDDPSHKAALNLVSKCIAALDDIPAKEKTKYSKDRLYTRFNNKFYGGNFTGSDSDKAMWLNGTKTSTDLADLIDEEIADIEGQDEFDYTGSPFKNRDEHLNRLKKLSVNLRNGVDESDYSDWVSVGGDGNLFRAITGLSTPEPTRENPVEKEWLAYALLLRDTGLSEEEIAARRADFYKAKLDALLAPFAQSDALKAWENFASTNWTGTGEEVVCNLGTKLITDNDKINWLGYKKNGADLKPSWLSKPGNAAYADNLWNLALLGHFTEGSRDGFTNSLILRLYVPTQLDFDPELFTVFGENLDKYIINSTIDLQSGTAIYYDRPKKAFIKLHVDPTSTPELLTALKKMYISEHPTNQITGAGRWGTLNRKGGKLEKLHALRNGGILKALSGALLGLLLEQNRENNYKASVTLRALALGVSEDAILYGDLADKTDKSKNSWLRGAGMTFDLAGAGLSFIPVVGNALGAISGTIGTGLNLAADMADPSVSKTEAMTNLTLNAGLTGLMLVPGGGSAKLAGKALQLTAKGTKAASAGAKALNGINTGIKVIGAIKPFVATGMVGYGGYSTIHNWDRMLELRAKDKAGILTHAERRELDNYYSVAAGTLTGGKSLVGATAPHLGNNVFGKTAATINDPLLALHAATGNKKAGRIFRSYTAPLEDAGTVITNLNEIGSFIKDAEGNPVKLNDALKLAIELAYTLGRTANISVEEMQARIKKAYLDNVAEGDNVTTIKGNRDLQYTKELNEALKEVFGKDPLAELTEESYKFKIGLVGGDDIEIEIPREKIKPLQEAYEKAYKELNTDGMSEEAAALAKNNAGLTKVKELLASMDEVKVKRAEIDIPTAKDFFLNGYKPQSDSTTGRILDKINPFSSSSPDNIGIQTVTENKLAADIWSNASNSSMRELSRRDADAYLPGKTAAALRALRLSNNWEMMHGTGAIDLTFGRELDTPVNITKGLREMFTEELSTKTDLELMAALRALKLLDAYAWYSDEELFSLIKGLKLQKGVKSSKSSQTYNKKSLESILTDLLAEKSATSKKSKKSLNLLGMAESARTLDPNIHKLGGKLNALKLLRGGIIKAASGIKFTDGKGENWAGTIFNVYSDDLIELLKRNGVTTMDKINAMLDSHHKMYTDANNSGNWLLTAFTYNDNDNIRNYLLDYDNLDLFGYNSKANVDAINRAYESGRYITDGNRVTGDGPKNGFKADNLYSAVTDDRRLLGRAGDFGETGKESELYTLFLNKLNEAGYEMYLDPNTNYYKLKLLAKTDETPIEETPLENPLTNPLEMTEDTEPLSKKKLGKKIDLNKLLNHAPDALAAARLIKNLNNNRKNKNLMLSKGVAYLSPILKHRNIYGDFLALQEGYRLAGALASKANQIASATSNAELAAAVLLDALVKANEAIEQGKAKDNAAIMASVEKANALQNEVYDYNHKVADENRARGVAKNNVNIDAEMAYNPSNTTNWNNYLEGLESQMRTKQVDDKLRAIDLTNFEMLLWWKDNVTDSALILALKAKYASTKDATILDLIAALLNVNALKYSPIRTEWMRHYYLGDYNWRPEATPLFTVDGNDTYQVLVAKQGTKVKVDSSRMKYRADDLRELRKQIKHNIDSNLKALDNLSKATLLELKKMMGI